MNRDRLLLLQGFACGALTALLGVLLVGSPRLRSQAVKTLGNRSIQKPAATEEDGKLRIIAFGAHPDDCELRAAGVAARWSALGHHVKFVSVTNGDIGHWRSAGGPLALRRTAEVNKCANILNIHTQVLDIHDGELL